MANDVADAFNPELWAQESLMVLEENMVVGNLVHRDFQDQIAQFGDVVNTRKPSDFTAKRKVDDDSVTVQDAKATNVKVELNQHVHTSFLIKDGEDSKSFKDLVNEFLRPAVVAQARLIDQVVLGQAYQFHAGKLGGLLGSLDDTTAKKYILETRQALNENKAPMDGRNLILTPNAETQLLKLDLFTAADKVGDEGSALREASLGRKLGFNMFMCQNTPAVDTGNTTSTGAINLAAGYVKGDKTFTVDGITGAIATGTWLTIAGDMTPLRVTAHTETLGNTTSITVHTGLRRAVADNAVITFYTPGAVNLAGGYAAGYAKEIVIDGFTVAPKVGQLVSFAAQTHVYSVVAVNGLVGITLDRPLEAAIADNDGVNIGPKGDYNVAFHKNAIALVVRPLALPRPGTGALAGVANYNGLSMRTTITYDGNKQGHLVTLDMLCGVKVLDTALGALLLG